MTAQKTRRGTCCGRRTGLMRVECTLLANTQPQQLADFVVIRQSHSKREAASGEQGARRPQAAVVWAMASDLDFSPPEVPEPTFLENLLRYGLFLGAIFQLICVLAIIVPIPKACETHLADCFLVVSFPCSSAPRFPLHWECDPEA
ncbi:protein MANBAL [Echinops telfairi]|uniref:Protein MANBAL n=1 Tax=Echinops telfairi TaxID=9371 RepID=A0AC55DH56_ECHTE|nr:protein MANBAL [Echinops telfairi]